MQNANDFELNQTFLAVPVFSLQSLQLSFPRLTLYTKIPSYLASADIQLQGSTNRYLSNEQCFDFFQNQSVPLPIRNVPFSLNQSVFIIPNNTLNVIKCERLNLRIRL